MTTIDITDLREVQTRVSAGVAWLDENHPGWADEIDVYSFTIVSTGRCVVAQVTGRSYLYGLDSLGLSHEQAADLGFGAWSYTTGGYDERQDTPWQMLNDAWKQVLRDRDDARASGGSHA